MTFSKPKKEEERDFLKDGWRMKQYQLEGFYGCG
jgi:hypothetical protein